VTPISLYRRVLVSPQPNQIVATRRAFVDLPLLPAQSASEMTLELEQRRADYQAKNRAGVGRAGLNPIGYHISWLESMLQRLAHGPLATSLTGEIWAGRLGDVAIVAAPAEIFTEIGYEVRRHSPFSTTIFAGYSQGVLGYVATAAEYAHGGYEPTVAHRGYGHPASFTPEVASILTDECLRLLRELAALAPVSRERK
jgi:neutral ceramidase